MVSLWGSRQHLSLPTSGSTCVCAYFGGLVPALPPQAAVCPWVHLSGEAQALAPLGDVTAWEELRLPLENFISEPCAA